MAMATFFVGSRLHVSVEEIIGNRTMLIYFLFALCLACSGAECEVTGVKSQPDGLDFCFMHNSHAVRSGWLAWKPGLW